MLLKVTEAVVEVMRALPKGTIAPLVAAAPVNGRSGTLASYAVVSPTSTHVLAARWMSVAYDH